LADARRALTAIALHRQVSDAIFLDQRGYGARDEMFLICHRTADEPVDRPAGRERATADYAQACARRRRVDLPRLRSEGLPPT